MARSKNGRKTSRGLSVKLKTAKGRKISSTRWLQRQLNDPYVRSAKVAGYRSRSAWKLVELDDQFKIFWPGCRILDLGAAPGGWTQVSVEKSGNKGVVLAVDKLSIEPIPGAKCLKLDMTGEGSLKVVKNFCGDKIDIVLSDMAAATTGHRQTDHIRTIALCEIAVEMAKEILVEGGILIVKVFDGGTETSLLTDLKRSFQKVKHYKPPASRKGSPEIYLIAQGFKI